MDFCLFFVVFFIREHGNARGKVKPACVCAGEERGEARNVQ